VKVAEVVHKCESQERKDRVPCELQPCSRARATLHNTFDFGDAAKASYIASATILWGGGIEPLQALVVMVLKPDLSSNLMAASCNYTLMTSSAWWLESSIRETVTTRQLRAALTPGP